MDTGRSYLAMRAVFFDLYETLITEYTPAWQDYSIASALGIDEVVCQREWRARHVNRMTGVVPDYSTVLREICKAAGIQPNEATIERLYHERLAIKAKPFRRVDSDILDMLRALRADGLVVCVVSNCSSEEVAAWNESSLAEVIDETVFSFQVGCMKPEREIYRLACRQLDTQPEQTVFVGDGGSNELSGAKQAGLWPVWATWFLERWPEWRMRHVDSGADAFPRCRTAKQLPELVAHLR